ncbi:MAG TPA: hypothetical protein VF099_17800 [Ktedonobacterales bacterium]
MGRRDAGATKKRFLSRAAVRRPGDEPAGSRRYEEMVALKG